MAIELTFRTMNGDESRRGSLLRAVERLRAGLPPSGVSERIAVGTSLLEVLCRRHLSRTDDNVLGLLVRGDYGTGKTHALTMLADLAQAEGYATCWLTADASEFALNHPQRFVAGLLRTLETPDRDSGYAGLLTRLLGDVASRVTLTSWLQESLSGATKFDRKGWYLARSLHRTTSNAADAEEMSAQDELIQLLAGESLMAKPNIPAYRYAAYDRLETAAAIMQLNGYRGLAIVIDEVESVFTKLPSIRSRHGAYRVLAAMLHSLREKGVLIALAITPDAFAWLMDDLNQTARLYGSPVQEPVTRLLRTLSNGQIGIWECRPLTSREFGELLAKIRLLYVDAYPEWRRFPEAAWLRAVDDLRARRPPTRLATREAVNVLDRLRLDERFYRGPAL